VLLISILVSRLADRTTFGKINIDPGRSLETWPQAELDNIAVAIDVMPKAIRTRGLWVLPMTFLLESTSSLRLFDCSILTT